MNDMYTRFRVYWMPNGGISMSYSVDTSFILVEARYNNDNREKIKSEMKLTGKDSVDLLHISSWSENRCNPEELELLLQELKPLDIEIPAYEPNTEDGLRCRRIIRNYHQHSIYADLFEVGHNSIVRLTELEDFDYLDPIFTPINKYSEESDNAVVKLFRSGKFSVLNLSDCIHDNDIISQINDVNLKDSIDVLVMNQFNQVENSAFLQQLIDGCSPRCIVSLSDWRILIRKDNPLSKLGIAVVVSEQKDVIVKYGLSKFQQTLNTDDVSVVKNVEYNEHNI